MERKKKNTAKKIIASVCVVALVIGLAVMPLVAQNEAESEGPEASILSGKAAVGTIQKEVIGGGSLANADAVSVEIPATVRLTSFTATNGQTVQKGDPIAEVDRVTVMTAIQEVQTSLDLLAEELESERKKETTDSVTALVGGTVKVLHAAKGESVQDIMLQHGSLAVLSLDGLMAVDLKIQSSLAVGSKVNVTIDGKTKVSGKIVSNLTDTVTVTIEDDDFAIGTTASVSDTSGNDLGTGSLYVYSAWSASAYTGTVSKINVSEGDTVKAGKTLMTLTDTGRTAKYQKLLSQRQEYEELLQRLFEMYQTKKIVAPCDGVVSGVDKDSTLLLSENQSYSITLLANAPNGDDETLYANYVASVSSIGENGWALMISSQSLPIADYKEIPSDLIGSTPLNRVLVYTPTSAAGAPIPIFELKDGTWVSVSQDGISADDILLLAQNEQGETVWIVRLQKAQTENPSQPSNPTNPSQPGNSSTGGNRPGSSGGSFFPGGGMTGGNSQTQEEEELFDLTMTELAQVTPQETLTLEITVDELDIHSIKIGMEAQIKINALGGEKTTAQVTEIGNVGTGNGGSSKFTVTLSMARSGDMLAGMQCTATLVIGSVDTVVTIPAKALVEEGNKTIVYTRYDEKEKCLTQPVEVKIGASDGENVQILSGITEGETYYYAYYDTLEISDTPDFGNQFMMFGR